MFDESNDPIAKITDHMPFMIELAAPMITA